MVEKDRIELEEFLGAWVNVWSENVLTMTHTNLGIILNKQVNEPEQ